MLPAVLQWVIFCIVLGLTRAANTTAPADRCDTSFIPCKQGLLLPPWQPTENLSKADRAGRSIFYFIALCYFFLGVSIISDRFMVAIEVITSVERNVKVKKADGEIQIIRVRVWNETVSNLTLMALGSSAPEILLSIIETIGNNFQAGELGPGTIVGSAAYNLFIIVGLCIAIIPTPETRRIKHNHVFWVTVVWSMFAYVWLYLILAVITKGVVDWWEGTLTFVFFFLTVITSWMADRRIFPGASFLQQRFGPNKNRPFTRPPTGRKTCPERSDSAVELPNLSAEEDAKEFEAHRDDYIKIYQETRAQHPDADLETIEQLAQTEAIKRAPKSRAFYRIKAVRQLVGAGNVSRKSIAPAPDTSNGHVKINKADSEGSEIKVYFSPGHYTCMENAGTMEVEVFCDRSTVPEPCVVTVEYKTVDGTATAPQDYLGTQGLLCFLPNEIKKSIGIQIIDNDMFEDDEHFYVHLNNPKVQPVDTKVIIAPSSLPLVKLATPFVATVMILDNDHCGLFELESDKMEIDESSIESSVKVCRRRGARGKVTIPYKTTAGSAKAGKDYTELSGELVFKDEEIEKSIPIKIHNNDSYQKSEFFYVEIGEPVWEILEEDNHDGLAYTEELRTAEKGKPVLGATVQCKIIIKESVQFKTFIDKMLKSTNPAAMVGTSSWKQQFVEAITLQSGEEDRSPSCFDYFMHVICLPWKVLFATVPPTEYLNGWACFSCSILMIGLLTAIIGDLATHFGCSVGLKDSVTSITLVAMGTSLPDTFASKVAAVQDDYADSSIVNVTGSNAVNVFLGIGVAWMIGSVYQTIKGSQFKVDPGSLAFSLTLFCVGAVIAIAILELRRYKLGAELGGPRVWKIISTLSFVVLWVLYICLSSLEIYCKIPGF